MALMFVTAHQREEGGRSEEGPIRLHESRDIAGDRPGQWGSSL